MSVPSCVDLCRYRLGVLLSFLFFSIACDVTGDAGTPQHCTQGEFQSLWCGNQERTPAQPAGCGSACTPLSPATVNAAMARVAGFSTEQLRAEYPIKFAGGITYDALAAANLGRIQQSLIALSDAERDLLQRNGFVLSQRLRFYSFSSAYAQLYLQHLPVYISADSLLHALHRSYDEMLAAIESSYLQDEIGAWLDGLRRQLPGASAAGYPSALATEVDVYLATALSLLRGYTHSPLVADAAAANAIASWVQLAEAASGPREVTLFGTRITVDFSQFKPRGHYTRSTVLQRYFRCLMWLGNAELRIVTTPAGAPSALNRTAVSAALLLHSLHDAESWQHRRHVDALLQLFVGEEDQLTLEQLTRLWATLGVTSPADLAARGDAEILGAITAGGFGVQRIVSQILSGGVQIRTFLLLGQRFVPDSQVMSSVVYDRAGGGTVTRTMPSPLDVAFATLRNNQALPLLQSELSAHAYAPDLAKARVLSDGYGEAFWHSNLYNGWLGALRTLSPDESAADPSRFGLPQLMGSEPWGRRLLNTQLGSWAQLRHDTILYAKPSTSSILCDFPDAYVDPYPAFYAALTQLGDRAAADLRGLSTSLPIVDRAVTYFEHLSEVSRMLGEMAELQRAGRPFADRHLAFVNELIQIHQGCTGFDSPGWYLQLMWDRNEANTDIPTIADVHTDPNSGGVLHVATGLPQLMVTSIDTCQGVRAYAGPVFSYHELTGPAYTRYTDEEWFPQARQGAATVPWLRDLTAPKP
jgi:hypothetical protein